MKKILIISNKSDVHTDSVVEKLMSERAELVRLNTEDFRANLIKYDDSGFTLVTKEGRELKPEEVASVFVRRINPADVSDVSKDYAEFAANEARVVLDAFPTIFSSARWLDIPSVRENASNKIAQLECAKAVGLTTPKTLITNNEKDAFKFCQSGKSIYKTLKTPLVRRSEQGEIAMINTAVITDERLDSLKTSVGVTPCLFQSYVDKSYELRVHIIGDVIVPIKIDSQAQEVTKVDWRFGMGGELEYHPCKVPDDIERKLLLLMRRFGLNFGVIDMVVTPGNEYVFLEINPNGSWLFIEQKIDLSISGKIADWLLEKV